MPDILESELFLYGGITIMVVSALAALVMGVMFAMKGKTLRKKLEEEYGKPM